MIQLQMSGLLGYFKKKHWKIGCNDKEQFSYCILNLHVYYIVT